MKDDQNFDEHLEELRALCVPGNYTEEELKVIETKGSELIRKWIDKQILNDLIKLSGK